MEIMKSQKIMSHNFKIFYFFMPWMMERYFSSMPSSSIHCFTICGGKERVSLTLLQKIGDFVGDIATFCLRRSAKVVTGFLPKSQVTKRIAGSAELIPYTNWEFD
jgi:hypothetical protein